MVYIVIPILFSVILVLLSMNIYYRKALIALGTLMIIFGVIELLLGCFTSYITLAYVMNDGSLEGSITLRHYIYILLIPISGLLVIIFGINSFRMLPKIKNVQVHNN